MIHNGKEERRRSVNQRFRSIKDTDDTDEQVEGVGQMD
jgi:hypothetical protein